MFVELFETVFSTFAAVVGSLADGVKEAFNCLVYQVDVSGAGVEFVNGTLSNLARFLFSIGGFGLAVGVLYGIFGLIRGKAHDRG